MKTFISTTYKTSPILAGKKIKSQAKWYLFGDIFSISSPVLNKLGFTQLMGNIKCMSFDFTFDIAVNYL